MVFEPEASQEDILEHSGIRRLIDMSIDGFSATCFCYGQTGSGKTHTLTGPPHLVSKIMLTLRTEQKPAELNKIMQTTFETQSISSTSFSTPRP